MISNIADRCSAGILEAFDEAQALEQLHQLGCTDGLPVIIPTPLRVERFVLASGLEGDLELGDMGPAMGAATVEKIAVAAVMAGCIPDWMPIVVAAVEAVLDERFDLTEMQATTHCTAPLILINGPVRGWCDIACGYGALGPGHRANASIGRALRLAMINIGGGRSGESDMALLGHPGKFTYCLGEDEESSPFEPLHVSLGFSSDDCTVTVIGAGSPHSVISVIDADDAESPSRLLDSLAVGLANVTTNNAVLRGGAAVVILNPDHAAGLAKAGFDRKRIQSELRERASHTRATLAHYVPAIQKRKNGDERVYAFNDADDILVVVAGGSGLYSAVMPSWSAGPHCNRFVTRCIPYGDSCEIPTADRTSR
jgi:hypothetical protein